MYLTLLLILFALIIAPAHAYEIKATVDKFRGTTTYSSDYLPVQKGYGYPEFLTHYIIGSEDKVYFLSFLISSNTIMRSDEVICLADGEKILPSESKRYDVNSYGGYRYINTYGAIFSPESFKKMASAQTLECTAGFSEMTFSPKAKRVLLDLISSVEAAQKSD